MADLMASFRSALAAGQLSAAPQCAHSREGRHAERLVDQVENVPSDGKAVGRPRQIL
jgi:hypothetical protein